RLSGRSVQSQCSRSWTSARNSAAANAAGIPIAAATRTILRCSCPARRPRRVCSLAATGVCFAPVAGMPATLNPRRRATVGSDLSHASPRTVLRTSQPMTERQRATLTMSLLPIFVIVCGAVIAAAFDKVRAGAFFLVLGAGFLILVIVLGRRGSFDD